MRRLASAFSGSIAILLAAQSRPVWWTDDGDTDGYSIRVGALPCEDVAPPTTTPPTTEPPTTTAPPTTPGEPTTTQQPTTAQPTPQSSGPATTAPAGNKGGSGSKGGALARTGADVGSGGVLALALLVSGGLLAFAGHRR